MGNNTVTDLTKQSCDYSIFDRFHGQHNCKNNTDLTLIVILNPFDHIVYQKFLCQTHSDSALEYYIFSYEKLSNEIRQLKKDRYGLIEKIKEHQKKENKTHLDFKEINNLNTKIKSVTKAVDVKEKLKNRISYHQCRECIKKIEKESPRIIVEFIHAIGKDRHRLHFCSTRCLVKFEEKSKITNGILTSLTSFS